MIGSILKDVVAFSDILQVVFMSAEDTFVDYYPVALRANTLQLIELNLLLL